MCILFSYISKLVKPNEFKLIILNNRDEFFFRASKPASLITENNIYGCDMTPGKEGGTWLGLNRQGRVGVLLNLDRAKYENDEKKAGRGSFNFKKMNNILYSLISCSFLGFMVPDYLNSSESFPKFVEPIKSNADKYNPFILVGYEKNNELWSSYVFDNVTAEPVNIQSGKLNKINKFS
jgi:uncharacterized protein with NRDE domain